MVWVLSARKERRLRELELFRLNRRAAQEDVTGFGEELNQVQSHQRPARDAYEAAQTGIRDARTRDDVRDVLHTLEGGRHPGNRARCFFDPTHGPSGRDVRWTPPNGVERDVPVCRQDLVRLEAGDATEPRRLRLGNRTVPWYVAGPRTRPTPTATSLTTSRRDTSRLSSSAPGPTSAPRTPGSQGAASPVSTAREAATAGAVVRTTAAREAVPAEAAAAGAASRG